ncbi:MAG: CoA-binding protein [Anaerolineales bacterium]|nr:CoA-binding protein [Chloroflexota bacterium]MBL6981832.1 CoA-binding protein [Anaerolineales bacterium]
MDQKIQDFIEKKRIAIVGASSASEKFGNSAAKELIERGYEVVYVHPSANEIDGQPVYRDLAAVKDKADAVWVCVPSEGGEAVLREAADAGFQNVWLQQGASSPELLKVGEELDLDLVSGKCILMYAEPVGSFHKFHQVIWKVIGQY